MTAPAIDKRDRLLVEALAALIDDRLITSTGAALPRTAERLSGELVDAGLATMRHDHDSGAFTLTLAGITVTTTGSVRASLREWQRTARALIERRAA